MIANHLPRLQHQQGRQLVSCLIRQTRSSISFKQFHTTSRDIHENRHDQEKRDYNPKLDVFRDNATKWWSGKEFSILRSMNQLRVPFIVNGLDKPMSEAKLLDVGCGGGILSEPLARLGADVFGIDPVFESINQAQLHAQADPDLIGRLKYRNCNIEDLSHQEEYIEAYDGLVASEVLEHIEDVEGFLIHCTKVLKPGGSLFITTINQTPLSWLGVIFFGLQVMLERMGYHIRLVNGFMYEPIGGNFYWTPSKLTHYAMHAIKAKPLAKGLNYQQKRYAPKGKKRPKKPLDDDEMMKVIPIDVYKQKAKAIVNDFQTHLETRLVTRTTTQAFETLKIKVEGLDEALELRDIAQLSMKGNNLIVINLSTMPEAIKPTIEALEQMGSVQTQVEVSNIYVPVPRITREHREKLVVAAKQVASQSKEKLRALFSDYVKKAKVLDQQGSGVPKDLVRDTIENLQFDMNQRLEELDSKLKNRSDLLLNQKN